MSKRGTERSASRRMTGSARKAAARRQRERRRRLAIVTVVVLVVAVGAAVAGILASRGGGATTAGYGHVTTFQVSSREHTNSPVSYPQNPPVGGAHNPVWQNCGYYDQPVRSENAVHSLEHGAVWITYQPNLPGDQVTHLADIAHNQTFVLVSPYSGLPAPVVASAWGVQEWFHTATDQGLSQFVAKYRQGPQTPERGATCSNGTGTPK
ncbi:MAG TPA: DUF3105 domain-containing protein [Actinomycetes bacterium]|jgi:hypothetical protein|nr:DUF3105 domain-containing protein [Actinomycetes bacterium]